MQEITEGLLDDDVSFADRFRVGTAELVVTQPRLPCFKLGIKLDRDKFVTEFLDRGLFGFYLSVGARVRSRQATRSSSSCGIRVGSRDRGRALYPNDRADVEGMRRAAGLDVLPESWRDYFRPVRRPRANVCDCALSDRVWSLSAPVRATSPESSGEQSRTESMPDP